MRISHRFKFVYLAITKTGSTTVRKLLDPFSDVSSTSNHGEFKHHQKAKDLRLVFDRNGWQWDDYFKFTLVRHPISRLRSIHTYMYKTGSNPPTPYHKKDAMAFYEKCKLYSMKTPSLEEAIMSGSLDFFPPQHAWVTAEDETTLLVNKIIKLEEISQELPKTWSEIGLPANKLKTIPVTNTSSKRGKELDLEISDKAIAKIKSKYSKDFDLFNYE